MGYTLIRPTGSAATLGNSYFPNIATVDGQAAQAAPITGNGTGATTTTLNGTFGAAGSKIGWRVDVTTGATTESRTVAMNTASTITLNSALGTAPNGTNTSYALQPFATIQNGIDYAEQQFSKDRLVAVFPGTQASFKADGTGLNPTGAYEENLIISKPLKLQGVGPGGTYSPTYAADPTLAGTSVLGADVTGLGFSLKTTAPTFAPESYLTDWYTNIAGLTWSGNQTVADGETIYVLATDGEYGADYRAQIDGLTIEGGDNVDFAGTNANGGGPIPPGGGGGPVGQPVSQGGGIFVNGYARHLQITNNVIRSNSGSYGGAIRSGTPSLTAADGGSSNHNEDMLIANNQILRNGGANLAGAIGLFNGSDNFHITQNYICGNFSAEYGAGISVYGMSPNGLIDKNRIRFNQSYDEGAGVIIAGELPGPNTVPNGQPTGVSLGSGPQTINANVIQENVAGDDGGGLRFLMSGDGQMDVTNNMIVNNISAHEGGGIAIDDATRVDVINNTIAKNISTATAMTSNGSPAPAGLSTGKVSAGVSNPRGHLYAQPVLKNNIFFDNRAGTYAAGDVTGIGPHLGSADTTVSHWDFGVPDGSAVGDPDASHEQHVPAQHRLHQYVRKPDRRGHQPAVRAALRRLGADVSVPREPDLRRPDDRGGQHPGLARERLSPAGRLNRLRCGSCRRQGAARYRRPDASAGHGVRHRRGRDPGSGSAPERRASAPGHSGNRPAPVPPGRDPDHPVHPRQPGAQDAPEPLLRLQGHAHRQARTPRAQRAPGLPQRPLLGSPDTPRCRHLQGARDGHQPSPAPDLPLQVAHRRRSQTNHEAREGDTMTDPAQNRLTRRRLLQVGGATLGAGALTITLGRTILHPTTSAEAATYYLDPSGKNLQGVRTIALAGTDGWITLPEQTGADLTNILIPSSQSVMPDLLAQDYVSLPSGNTPVPQNAYIYCFRDVTRAQVALNADLTDQNAHDRIFGLKGQAQQCAPIIGMDAGEKYHLTLYNLGWQVRPDIPDGHTVHFHGFKNAIPWFDGVPEMSGGAPQGKTFHYFYQPIDPGTYMYHCHWEDVEHVQMGMTGVVFVRPKRNTSSQKYAYETGDNGYDREFTFMLMDYDIEQHWKLAHIQQPDWSDYKATHWTMNGRSYPDTLLPNHNVDIDHTDPYSGSATIDGAITEYAKSKYAVASPRFATGALNGMTAADAADKMAYQPISSRVMCNAGEKVLLRIASLGYEIHNIALDGIKVTVHGRDASLLKNDDGTITAYETDTMELGAGEAYDAIFTAPDHSTGVVNDPPDVYMMYDRNYAQDAGNGGFGGMATEIHVYPTGTLSPQTNPNEWGV